ncbi:MAG: aldehyde dehydrogenase family protein [Actinomycetota bacterium]|nr:aldehyde dehydrogenase family protein [Actinomycetota bacterium]
MSSELRVLSNFINGEFATLDGGTSEVFDPSTGQAYASAALSGAPDLDRAYAAAARAFESWGRTTPAERQRALLEVADALESRADEFVAAESENKAPVIVFDDAGVEAAAAIAITGYSNGGQDCTAATRVMVSPGIHDDFVVALTEQARNTVTGAPSNVDALYGPVNNANQLIHIGNSIDPLPDHAALNAGGSKLTGGDHSNGYFYEPTVVSGPDQQDEAAQNEIFGPAITVQKCTDERQALAYANGTRYGLASSVWTADHSRAMRMSAALNVGCVRIKTHIPLVAETPHGGFGHSRYGKDPSLYSLEDYPRLKHVMSAIGTEEHG